MFFYEAISDFIFMEDVPSKADVIFVPGGNYPDSAVCAARMYREGYAPYVLPSGRFAKAAGVFTGPEGPNGPYETEWDYLSDILIRHGVPETAILKENRATFTWENAIFSKQVLEEKGIVVQKALLCCQAFHARRAWMYYKEQFPETELIVVPTVTRGIAKNNWFLDQEKTNVVLGEMSRIGEQFHCALPLGTAHMLDL